MVALLGMAALAVDLGWIYLNGSRLQAAADAAALAGVVNLPGFPAQATDDATAAAGTNGFTVGSGTSLADNVLADNQYEVTLDSDIPTFFLNIFGIDEIAIERRAVAEYVKPVKLGSPSNQFGGGSSGFWAAINGRLTDRNQGDPFMTQCINASTSSPGCDSSNPWYRAGGYYYAVEVATGSTGLQVSLYDPGHFLSGSGSPTRSGSSSPSDTSWRWNWPSGQRGVNLQAYLYRPDTTPSDPTDNTSLACSASYGTYTGSPPSSSNQTAGGFNSWKNLCSSAIANPTPGIWVLRLPPPDYEGSSKFAIRATTSSGSAPKVYGLLDMSIHVNQSSGTTPYLAEVRPEHAGKTLEVDIFDFGEAASMSFRIIDPDGNTVNCTWEATNGESNGSLSPCDLNVSNGRFNHAWLYLTIPIPDTYTCDPAVTDDCWWKVSIYNMSNPTDRTTWSARISGDPVRLVE
jgi:hypothetical protein